MEKHTDQFIARIKEITSQDPSRCYQCGKCSAGCPVRDFIEIPPNRVVRYVQLGFYKQALQIASIWMCTGCLTCSSRCPQEFEIAKFMDALRQIAIEDSVEPDDPKVLKFHRAFMKQIKNNGRAFELGLIRDYKLSTGALFQDIDIAPFAILKGKISFTPHKIKGKEAVKKIINKVLEK